MLIALLRTLILYVVIMICIRLMGKRQVGELQTNEFVITLLISELASIPMQESGTPLFSGIVPILTLVGCELIVSAAMVKWSGFRQLLCGKPVVLIRNGQPDFRQLARVRLSIEDLTEALRLQNVFDLNEVAFAAAETNGQICVLKKPQFSPPDAQTLGVTASAGFSVVVVSDGQFCPHAAILCGRTKAWVQRVLHHEKCELRDVRLLLSDANGKYTILLRNAVKSKGGKLA